MRTCGHQERWKRESTWQSSPCSDCKALPVAGSVTAEGIGTEMPRSKKGDSTIGDVHKACLLTPSVRAFPKGSISGRANAASLFAC